MYRILTVLWLVCGVTLIVWDWIEPAGRSFSLPGTRISAGWLALLLAGYNALRSWSSRSAAWRREVLKEARRHRQQRASMVEQDPDSPEPTP